MYGGEKDSGLSGPETSGGCKGSKSGQDDAITLLA